MMDYSTTVTGDLQMSEQAQNESIGIASVNPLDIASLNAQSIFFPTIPLKPNPRLSKDAFTPEQDHLLMTLKQAGKTYSDIADAMRSQLGADISVNRLVKRFDKIRELYLEVSTSLPGSYRPSFC